MASDVLTSEQAADYLQLGISTLKRMAREDRIPAAKAGRQWRFRKAELDEWLARGGERYEELVDEGIAIVMAERKADPANHQRIPWEQVKAEFGL